MPEISSSNLSPEEQMMNEELFNIYENSLNELPERCRTIFIKVREEKQSYASVAEELNISPKTVDAQLQKAVTRLKEKLTIILEIDDRSFPDSPVFINRN